MYCTISSGDLSTTDLGDDAVSAYHTFLRKARMLGTISRSFETLASRASAAYFTALSRPAPATWTAFVERTAVFVAQALALKGIIAFDGNEREALEFFEAIARENADLLRLPVALASASSAEKGQFPSV
jgi:hypothetical protein